MGKTLTVSNKQVYVIAAMIGDPRPVLCAQCRGSGVNTGLWRGISLCRACNGTGFEHIPPKTKEALDKLKADEEN